MAKRKAVEKQNGHKSNGHGNSGSGATVPAPQGGIRAGGKFYRSGAAMPARYGRVGRAGQGDPASGTPLAPPNFGRAILPHGITFIGKQSTIASTFRNPDEAVRHSGGQAWKMRRDPAIMECLEARQRATALLNWHLEVEDEKDPEQKQLKDQMTKVLQRSRQFTEYRRNLLEALWYGRYAVQHKFGWTAIEGQRRLYLAGWDPINGDKLVFRFDDGSGKFQDGQIGIRCSPIHGTRDKVSGNRKLEYTVEGPAYFLEPYERSLLAVHKHIIEDGDYEDPLSAGRIHGVGIRDRIYWCWFQKQETMAQLMEVIDRTGSGITIYWYPAGDNAAKEEVEDLAIKQKHENVLVMPRMSGDPASDAYGIERVEPSTAGIDAMRGVVHEFFGHQIKRYISGQTLTSESESLGIGGGGADVQQETWFQIIRYDAVKLEETIGEELVEPLKLFNFPKARDIPIWFRIDTKSSESEKKMQAIKSAWDMGARVKASDVMDIVGLSMPGPDDETLQNPQMAQQPGGEVMPGQPGAAGEQGDDLKHLLGPLADVVKQDGGGESGQEPGQEPGGAEGGQEPPSPFDRPEQYAKRQIRSTAGQQALPGLTDRNAKKPSKWKEELHPRDEGGKFDDKPGSQPKNSHGQGYIFSDLASKLKETEDYPDSDLAKAKQQELFEALAKSDVPPEQLHALLSGDDDRLEQLKNAAQQPEFLTAGEAAKQGKSFADWQLPISDAFVKEQINEDHPAWQSIQHDTSPHPDDYYAASHAYGQHVRTSLGHFGKVTDVAPDAKSVTVTHEDGTTSKHGPAGLGHLEAIIADKQRRGRPTDKEEAYLANATGKPSSDTAEEPFSLQQQSVREAAPASAVPETGGRQEAFWHGLNDKPGQGKMFGGMDLAGKAAEHLPESDPDYRAYVESVSKAGITPRSFEHWDAMRKAAKNRGKPQAVEPQRAALPSPEPPAVLPAAEESKSAGAAATSPAKTESTAAPVVVDKPPPGGWSEKDKVGASPEKLRHIAAVEAGHKPWSMTQPEWDAKSGGSTGWNYRSDVFKAISSGENVPDQVLDQGDGSFRTFKEVTDNDRKYSAAQLDLMRAKTTALTEGDYLQQQSLKKQREGEHQEIMNRREIAKLGPKAAKKKAELEGHAKYWRSQAEDAASGKLIERSKETYRKKYLDEIKSAISKGLVTDPKIIKQYPEFEKARTARERYEKGLHTSFANKSIAVDSSMKPSRGYKAKQQDGAELTPKNKAELERGVDEIEAAIGPLKDLFDQTDLTLAHTNGKYPFLSTAGGLYHPADKTVTSGTAIKTPFGTVKLKALAHEIGHWLDYEAGSAFGWNGRAWHHSPGARSRGKMVNTTSVAEMNEQLVHDDPAKTDLIHLATQKINDQREVMRLTKAKLKDAKDDADRAHIETAKVKLGPYWTSPHEVWARLFEQYVGDHHGSSENSESHEGRDYFRRPGYWTEKDWQTLKPMVKQEIERRLGYLRAAAAKSKGNAQ